LFRNAPGLFFLGRVHEQAFSSIEVRCQQWSLKHLLGQTALLHHGYTAEIVSKRDKVERNLRLLERAIEELPDEPNLLMNYGLELTRSGQLQDGLEQYAEAIRCAAERPASEVTPELRETLLTQLTTHLMSAKMYGDIVHLWQTTFAKSGSMTASQHFSLGLAYMELQKAAPAAEQMRQCLAKREAPTLSPKNPAMLKGGPAHCLALCLAKLQQPAAAADSFRAAIDADPKARPPRFDFARFLAETGKPIDALKWLNELVSENAADLEAWFLGGKLALSKPEFRAFACDWTGEAVKNFSADPAILLQRAEALFLAERMDLALPFWRSAVLPKNPRANAARVLCEILQDDCQFEVCAAEEPALSQEALKWYRRLIAVGATGAVQRLHQKIDAIRLILPGFVAVWETATRKVATAVTA
jgi:tetratricopeptide (TPR) repeat protein